MRNCGRRHISYSTRDGDDRNMNFQPENPIEDIGINGRIILKIS
jgi:hypothetical protein